MTSDPDDIPCILLIDYTCVRGVETVSDLLGTDACAPYRDRMEPFLSELRHNIPWISEHTLHTDIEDDGLFIELILENSRAGFLFTPDQSESGWFVIINGGDGTVRRRGTFDDIPKAVSEVSDLLEGRMTYE